MKCPFAARRAAFALPALALAVLAVAGSGYPLDGEERTGISRLEGYRVLQDRLLARGTLHPGSLRGLAEVSLARPPAKGSSLEPDATFSLALRSALEPNAARYSVSVLDLTDPDAIRYAAHQDALHQNPGSVGKILVALAWMQALADLHPDVESREQILRETRIRADSFIQTDSHEVPFWQPGEERIAKRPLRIGDTGNLWTYLDWMLSSSSNAAASMLLQQLVVLKHFGLEYPPVPEAAEAFLKETPASSLREILMDALLTPITRNGLDTSQLRQGGLFTHEGKRRIPGGDSTSTSRELMRLLWLMESGELVDEWSSLELKRLLYLTDRRIRYASHPVLSPAAVYFKSGSLYSCKEEPGFECGKYRGNVRNFMNSVAIVEDARAGRKLHYAVVVLSNVLRENSAVAHQTLALRIHRLIEARHPAREDPPATAAEGAATD